MVLKNVPGRFVGRMSSWRKIATGAWSAANDPTIYGTLEINVASALEYIARVRASSGRHVTITHLVTKAIADTLALHPECNGYVRLGHVFQRDTVDTFVLVAVPPERAANQQSADLTGVKIYDADTKSLTEIGREVRNGAKQIRRGYDREFAFIKRLFKAAPGLVLGPLTSLTGFLQYGLNLDLTQWGVPRDSFGCALVTSVGMMGIQNAFVPLIPMARLTCLIAVGAIEDKAVVESGEVVVRPMLPITATFDHRVVDGYQAANLARTFKRLMADPAAWLGEVPALEASGSDGNEEEREVAR